jgi:hypothetical protein
MITEGETEMTEKRQDYLQYFNSAMLLVLVLRSFGIL